MTAVLFDHYSNQEHESVAVFLNNWGPEPWDYMNVPIGLYIGENDEGQRYADIIVYLPRKEHIKHIKINITSAEDMAALRKTFLGIGERIYEPAAYNLEAFAKGGMPEKDENGWRGFILYFWKKDEFVLEE